MGQGLETLRACWQREAWRQCGIPNAGGAGRREPPSGAGPLPRKLEAMSLEGGSYKEKHDSFVRSLFLFSLGYSRLYAVFTRFHYGN